MPPWTAAIAHHRDFFENTALVVCDAAGNQKFWKVLYFVLSPSIYLALSPLEPVEYNAPMHDESATPRIVYRDTVTHAFKCNFANNMSVASMPLVELDDLCVLQPLRHDGGTLVTCNGEVTPLRLYWQSEERRRLASQ